MTLTVTLETRDNVPLGVFLFSLSFQAVSVSHFPCFVVERVDSSRLYPRHRCEMDESLQIASSLEKIGLIAPRLRKRSDSLCSSRKIFFLARAFAFGRVSFSEATETSTGHPARSPSGRSHPTGSIKRLSPPKRIGTSNPANQQ